MTPKISQIGIVVKDMAKAVEFYKKFFNLTDIPAMEMPPGSMEIRGEKFKSKLKIGFGRVGDIQVEIIQVMEGRSVHSLFLEQGREGFHHIGMYVDDLDSEVAKMAEKGIQVLARGDIMGTKWAYMDTEAQAGTIYELIELAKSKFPKKVKPAK